MLLYMYIYNTLTLEGKVRVVGDPLGGAEVAHDRFSADIAVPRDRMVLVKLG